MSAQHLQAASRILFGTPLSSHLRREALRLEKETNSSDASVKFPVKQTQLHSCPRCSLLMVPGVTCSVRLLPANLNINLRNKNRRARKRYINRLNCKATENQKQSQPHIYYFCNNDAGFISIPAYEINNHGSNARVKPKDVDKPLRSQNKPGAVNKPEPKPLVSTGLLSLNDFLL